jgi:RNA recognition motif-containing protein
VSARALLAPTATATADFVALRLPLSVMIGTSPNIPTINLQYVVDNQSSTAQQIREDEEEAANPGSNLFVTGIHPRLTEEEVRRLFEKYGDVETCSIMRDPHTRESRGFGFVNMVTGEQADAAKSGLQGEVYEGRTLSIEKARRSRPRTPTPGKYFGPPKRSKQPRPQHTYFPTDSGSSR